MILAHPFVGLLLGKYFGYPWFLFIGSVIADLDHLAVLYKHRIFTWPAILDSMRYEDTYYIRFKTKYAHSLFGAILACAVVSFIDLRGAGYFFLAYIGHLILDWPDRDEKQFFWPFSSKKIRGFLPIFSKPEIIFTVLLLILLVVLR